MTNRAGRNPASTFLNGQRSNSVIELIESYAGFLRSQARISALPVDLNQVLGHLGIRRRFVALAGQRALTTPDLAILVEEGDLPTVQIFSTAHELMEFLYIALEQGDGNQLPDKVADELTGPRKESWCERGAAELVMPRQFVWPEIAGLQISLSGGRVLAERCGVSLTAALRRLLELKETPGAVVAWRYGHSSGEYVPSRTGQSNLFGSPTAMDPPQKLRVARVFPSHNLGFFIPREKSVEEDTHIFEAFETGAETHGLDKLDLGTIEGTFYTESLRVTWSGEPVVLSLLIPSEKLA